MYTLQAVSFKNLIHTQIVVVSEVETREITVGNVNADVYMIIREARVRWWPDVYLTSLACLLCRAPHHVYF